MDLFDDLPETSEGKDKLNGNMIAHDSGTKEGKSTSKKEETDDKNNVASSFLDLPIEQAVVSPTKRKSPDQKIESCHKSRLRTSVKYRMKGFVAEQKGERDEMQDAHIVCDNFHDEIPHLHPTVCRLSLYGVFDGHAGARASKYAAQYLKENLKTSFPEGDVEQIQKDIKKCLIEVFKKTDENFLQEATKSKPAWKDGTTAVLVIVINDVVYIANLGDSKAVLCRYKEDLQKHIAVPLTVDHCPTSYEERIRIQKVGGVVRSIPQFDKHQSVIAKKTIMFKPSIFEKGNITVKISKDSIDGRVMGVIGVSRSIGDGPYKKHGLTCIPDVRKCQLTDQDRFIIIACDGLWNSYTLDESIDEVNKCLQNECTDSTSDHSSTDSKYLTACQTLVRNAVLKLSGDNVTVLIVRITPS